MKILITGPSLSDQGGVASYYNAVLPLLQAELSADYFELGGTTARNGLMHFISDQIEFYCTIKKNKPDIVHINPSLNLKSFIRDGLLLYQCTRLNIPSIVFFHGWNDDFHRFTLRSLNWFFLRTYQKSSAFIVLASDFKKKLQAAGVEVPIYLATTTIHESLLKVRQGHHPERINSWQEPIKILFLARLDVKKGVLETLNAVNTLQKNGANISLTVAGDGPAMPQVQKWLNDNNTHNNDRIQITGDVRGKHKERLLATHDIYCLPTTYGEGLPTSLLEAMACGMAVVTCKAGGIGDFFEQGKMGVLLSDNQPDTIASAMKSLADNREEIKTIGIYNHNFASKHFVRQRAKSLLCMAYGNIGLSEPYDL